MNGKKKTAGLVAGVIVILVLIGLIWWRHGKMSGPKEGPQREATADEHKTVDLRDRIEDCIPVQSEEKLTYRTLVTENIGDCDKCFFDEALVFYLGSNDYLYILDLYRRMLNVYDRNGLYIRTIHLEDRGLGRSTNNLGIYLEIVNGRIYILDIFKIYVYDDDGKFLMSYVLPISTGESPRLQSLIKIGPTIALEWPPNYIQNKDSYPAPYSLFRDTNNNIYVRVIARSNNSLSGRENSLYFKLNSKWTLEFITKDIGQL